MPLHHGRTRLPRRTVARLYKLVDSGLTYLEVAKRCRCHENTVYNHVKARRLLAARGERVNLDDSQETTRRCPSCGALCDMPCLACEARKRSAHRRLL